MSIACPTCCSRSRVQSTIAQESRKPLGDRGSILAGPSAVGMGRGGLVAPLDLGLHGIEHRSPQFLRNTLANRSAFDDDRSGDGLDHDVPTIARYAFGMVFDD